MKTAISSNAWQNQCRGELNSSEMRSIQSMEQVFNQEEDICVWVGSSDGLYTIKSAWNMYV